MKRNIPCKTCGKERLIDTSKFSVARYMARSPNCRICATKNPELRAKISKGWFTAEDAAKMRLRNLGRPAWNKGLKGIHLSPLSEFKPGQMKGENNVNWKGGITPVNMQIRQSREYKDWRTAVFQRDDYTCQECRGRGYKLHADHIKPFAYFPELRLVIDNGRTLCVECHRKTPTYSQGAKKIYGKA